MIDGHGIHVKVDKNFRPLQNKDNDYLIDRTTQKSGRNYSGVEGIGMQDASLQESMGPIQDRTKENLVSTDNGIIMARHRLVKAAKELAAKGTPPPGRDPVQQKVRSVAVVLPAATPFKEGAGEALKAKPGVAQTSV
jgi:phthalate 4,5-dioxygenase oxygenase subunit